MRGIGTGGDFSFVQGCARIAEICVVHKAARPMTREGEGMKEGQEGGLRARSTPGPVSVLLVSAADLAIYWRGSFRGAARSAGEAVETKQRQQMAVLGFQER